MTLATILSWFPVLPFGISQCLNINLVLWTLSSEEEIVYCLAIEVFGYLKIPSLVTPTILSPKKLPFRNNSREKCFLDFTVVLGMESGLAGARHVLCWRTRSPPPGRSTRRREDHRACLHLPPCLNQSPGCRWVYQAG